MAIIVCPECGNEVSNQSNYCVHCGYPLNQTENQSISSLSELQSANLIEAYDVMLVDYDGLKISVISDLVEVLNISRNEARNLLQTLPVYIYNDIPKADAEYVARRLQNCNMRIAVYDPSGNVRYFEPPRYINRPLPVVAPIPRKRRIVTPAPIKIVHSPKPAPSPFNAGNNNRRPGNNSIGHSPNMSQSGQPHGNTGMNHGGPSNNRPQGNGARGNAGGKKPR